MEGLAPFDTALAGFERQAEAAPDTPARPEREEFSPDDPINAPFEALPTSGQPATIAIEAPGIRQQWRAGSKP